MYLTEGLSLLLLLGATVATHCAAHQETLMDASTLSRNDQPKSSENGLFSVPLNETARTGAIPIDQEELIISLGNRFANEFYQNISSDGGLGTCFDWQCAGTIKKELPCIYKAIKTLDPLELLKCGLKKPDICKCVDCLPFPKLRHWLEKWCASDSDGKVKDEYNYGDFYHLSDVDLELQAFLGNAKKYHLEQNKGGLGCTIGHPCGDCPCCVGLCQFGYCFGWC